MVLLNKAIFHLGARMYNQIPTRRECNVWKPGCKIGLRSALVEKTIESIHSKEQGADDKSHRQV
jgi:hypothetical protein